MQRRSAAERVGFLVIKRAARWKQGLGSARAVQISEWGGTFVIALSGTLDLWAVGRKSDWGSKLCRVPRRRRGRAKNEALFPGRVPHVRPSVHGPKMTGRSPSQRFS